jgi:HEPN domain-containing protein/predicted nucleotidyltransferase
MDKDPHSPTSTMYKLFDYSPLNPPVTDELLAKIVSLILSVGNPLKILLFGSRARGDFKPYSDIDIFILEESSDEISERASTYNRALADAYPERTIIVRSLRDVEEWKNVPNCLESEAMTQGKVLYENSDRLGELLALSGGNCLVREELEHKSPVDLARHYVLKAESDLLTANLILRETEGPYDTVCFHAQQAVEKYLKTVLALHGARIKKTHQLDKLIKSCLSVQDLPDLHGPQLERLSNYAIEARYAPGFWPNRLEAEQAVELAEHLTKTIREHLPQQVLSDRKGGTN